MRPRRARSRVTIGFIAAAVGGAALASACSEQVASKGRVQGQVRVGLGCATQQGQVCVPRAVDGEVAALRDGEVKARTRTGPTGRYELLLTAGSYTLVVHTARSQCPSMAVDVRAASSGTVDIDCGP